jgi:hypothetical protein
VDFGIKYNIMKNIDVDIYLTQLKKFFKDNPSDLTAIIGNIDSDLFYEEVRNQAILNIEKGEEVQLTQIQILNIIVKLSRLKKNPLFIETQFGKICLN